MNSSMHRISACLIVGVFALSGSGQAADPPASIPRSALNKAAPSVPPELVPPGAHEPATAEVPALEPVPEGVLVADGAPQMPMTDSCQTYFGRGTDCPPKWYVDTGVRLMNRLRAPPAVLGEAAISTDEKYEALNTTNANFDAPAGYTVTIGRHLGHDIQNNDDFLEFTYWGCNHWSDSYTVNAGQWTGRFSDTGPRYTTGILYGQFGDEVSGFNNADTMSIRYDSEVHNFEWNLRLVPRHKQDRLVLHPDGRWERETPLGWTCNHLIGLRYISYDESFQFASHGMTYTDGVYTATSTGEYRSFTQNDMLGIQVGTEIYWQEARWSWGVRVKAGPYTNWCAQRSNAWSTGAAIDPLTSLDVNYETRGSDAQMAFVGELGLFASYKLRKNVHLHASYDFFWMSNQALAPKQISYEADPPDHVHNSTTMLLQGISLRAEFLW